MTTAEIHYMCLFVQHSLISHLFNIQLLTCISSELRAINTTTE